MNIKQIAKEAGVSVATVSRVINHPENVAPKTRERIQKIIDEEEYTPNYFAQGLNFNRTRTIGLVLPQNINSANMEVANGVEDVARQKGYITFMCNTGKNKISCNSIFRVNSFIRKRKFTTITAFVIIKCPSLTKWLYPI